MKRIIIGLMMLLFLCGCQKAVSNNNTTPTKPPNNNSSGSNIQNKINDYFPYNKDTIVYYKGIGNEYAQKDVSVDFIKGNRIQLRTNNGGTVTVQVLEKEAGELRLLYSRGECYYREDFTNTNNLKPEILLKEPLVKGTSWTLPDGKKRYISEVDKEIQTPMGTYKAIEVTTENEKDKDLTHDYYAKNAGMVKNEFITNGETISSTLEKIEKNVPVKQTMKFYYPYFEKEKIAFVEKNISLKTNDNIIEVLETHLKKKLNDNLSYVLSKNVTINKLSLDVAKNQVNVDFSKDLVTGMNAGSGFEGMLIDSITDTLGNYYGADKVYITMEGEPYSSGHIAMGKDEPFYVDYGKTMLYK
jgi:hypothetical protein